MRPSLDQWGLSLARVVATRGTCARRQVGCVLVDEAGKILATGYNGVASGRPHCINNHCPGAFSPSGQGLDICEAIHAEQNALLQCPDTRRIHTCYTTVSPCMHCVKMLLNTSCRRIVFDRPYSQDEPRKWWLYGGGTLREWIELMQG